MKSKNDIPGEISLDQAGTVLSHSVRLLDILGEAECQRIIGQQFVTFLVNEVKIELGRYFAEFEKTDGSFIGLVLEVFSSHKFSTEKFSVLVELQKGTVFELMADINGNILEMEPKLLEILPEDEEPTLEKILENFEERKIQSPTQHIFLKTNKGSLLGDLILRGSVESENLLFYDVSILHEIVGTIKADEYGYIYDSDRTLKETILRENSFQNIFKFLKIPSQNYAIRDLREVSKYNDWIKVESNIPNCSSISRMEIKVTERTHSFSVELKIKLNSLKTGELQGSELSHIRDDSFEDDFRLDQNLVVPRYEIGNLVGCGGYGQVHYVQSRRTKERKVGKFIFKEKVVKWYPPGRQGAVPLEVHICKSMVHKNIVKCVDYVDVDHNWFLMVMRDHHGSDLFDFIESNGAICEFDSHKIMTQLVSAVRHLARNHIIHRDIKDENIIIDNDLNIQLIDFGSALKTYGKAEDAVSSKFFGTIKYCPPEAIKQDSFRALDSDIWAIGILLFTLLHGVNPFYDVHEILHLPVEIESSLSNTVNVLLNRLLERNPVRRIRLREIESDEWFLKGPELQDQLEYLTI